MGLPSRHSQKCARFEPFRSRHGRKTLVGIQFVNSPGSGLTDTQVADYAEACNIQLHEHVAPAWRQSPLSVSVHNHPSWYRFEFHSTIPEAPGALAYHDVDENGKPYGRIGVKTTLDAGETVSSAASHEAVELFCDTFCQDWMFSNRLRALVAKEACDPCQSQSYEIDGVEVSDFVLPTYFEEGTSAARFTYRDNVSESFGIASGGYQIRMKAGTVTNVFGDVPPSPTLMAGKGQSHGRSYWREVQAALIFSGD